MSALRHILPPVHVDEILLSKTTAKGHHGNPIVVLETRIKDRNMVRATVETLSSNLSRMDKETLMNDVEKHVEKGSFYLRLDKQAAFRGKFKLALADPIRVRLRLKKSRFDDVVEICREIGMLPR